MKFAKLFDLENDIQVLLTIEYREENDTFEMITRTNIGDCVAQIAHEYQTEEIAVKNMEKFSREQAIVFRDTMTSLF